MIILLVFPVTICLNNETLSMNDDNPYITLMVYWQYRAERVGMEQDCAGIMRVDGSARPVAYAAKDFGEDLHKNMQYLAGAEVEEGDIAIVFDFDSLLMSEIEEASKDIFQYAYTPAEFYYTRSHKGMYKLLRKCG